MLKQWGKKLIGPAAVIVLAATWLLSGGAGGDNERSDASSEPVAPAPSGRETEVRVLTSLATSQSRELTLRGRTVGKRTVTVRAETSAQVAARPVERGAQVAAGDLLCQLEPLDREARVRESQDSVALATLEHQGLLSLREQGLQRELSIAQAKSRLSAAERRLAADRIELAKSAVTAPIAGFVEEVHAEVGDYLQAGSPCATILDLDPIHVEAAATEQQYAALEVGAAANVLLVDGRNVTGEVTFVGRQSSNESRTFPIEITVPNRDFAISSGLSAEVRIALSAYSAHKVSVSYVVLDANNQTGVRTVDNGSRVRFFPIEIIREEGDSLWVSGLPENVTLITLGQELVAEGERVKTRPQGSG
ncbi:MAG: efflux RND transporter periplasmic adaptor subunit [Gammaproteobacteria bacterium]|nr:efflux RND transporter periplasmic adaptor subunit [Gammaproteobacteria bacterium]MCY4255876.1 efflux RND transporter periplasmic adaptor subunit [Gammaproteobacteria bacterium]